MHPRVLGISGSLRVGSRTEKVVVTALEAAAQVGAETELLDLRALRLPFFDAREEVETYDSSVIRLLEAVRRADGLILATPVYHGTLSGSLKNALDLLELLGRPWLQGKVAGLIAIAGGDSGTNAINSMEFSLRALHAWTLPTAVVVPGRAFGPDDEVRDRRIGKRLSDIARRVAASTSLFTGNRCLLEGFPAAC